jgi:acyl carrier protein
VQKYNLTELEREIGVLLIDCLNLEDIKLEDIDPDAALFNSGLGLDSIDALELAMSLTVKYGVQLRTEDPDNARYLSSLRALSEYIESHS